MRSKMIEHTLDPDKCSIIPYKSRFFENTYSTSKYNTGFFHTLPQELLVKISQYVNYQDFSILMQTCKFFCNDVTIREISANKTAGWLAAGANHTIMYLDNNSLLVVGDNKFRPIWTWTF